MQWSNAAIHAVVKCGERNATGRMGREELESDSEKKGEWGERSRRATRRRRGFMESGAGERQQEGGMWREGWGRGAGGVASAEYSGQMC